MTQTRRLEHAQIVGRMDITVNPENRLYDFIRVSVKIRKIYYISTWAFKSCFPNVLHMRPYLLEININPNQSRDFHGTVFIDASEN